MKTLTDLAIKNLKDIGRYSAGGVDGLHLWVKSDSHRYWILRYTIFGKRKDMSLGSYPSVTLKEARLRALEARKLIVQGADPLQSKKALLEQKMNEVEKPLFREFALKCVEEKSREWRNKKHAAQWIYTLERFAFPIIGLKTLDSIDTGDILSILKPIWVTKTHTAMRLRGRLEWILGSASTQGFREGINPALWRGHLMTVLPSPNKIAKTVHHAALPYQEVGDFVKKLRDSESISALALEFTILTAARTEEVLAAKRCEINGDLWVIPAERMKVQKEQRVPLTARAKEILSIAQNEDPDSEYLFSRNGRRLCSVAMLSLVKGMGYNVTVHGFRATFRTWSEEETEYHDALAKKALAHTLQDKVDEAYNRGDLLKKRLKLMEDWAKFCDTPSPNNVYSFKVA